MYYIVNQDNQIIAADNGFLSLLMIDNLQELFNQAVSDKLTFKELDEDTLEVAGQDSSVTLNQSRHPLHTLMGNLILVEVSEIKESIEDSPMVPNTKLGGGTIAQEEVPAEPLVLDDADDVAFIKPLDESLEDSIEEVDEGIDLLDDEEFIKIDTEPEEEPVAEEPLALDDADDVAFIKPLDESLEDSKEEVDEGIDLLGDEDFIKIDIEPKEEPVAEEPLALDDVEPQEDTDDTINLLPDEKIDIVEPIKTEEPTVILPSDTNIFIDTDKISKILGISKEDYSSFLDEFIDKAIAEEESIKNIDSSEHHSAITSLFNLSQMLHLTDLAKVLQVIEKGSAKEQQSAIDSFYKTLAGLTTHPTDDVEKNDAKPKSGTTTPALKIKGSKRKERNYDDKICDLELGDVKPIHFDFQPKNASEELGLPLDLIEEFVHDFIVQAREEKQTFIDACLEGDIDTLHKTGHKLKGAASNLRIVPLAETLEEIQFCEDNSRFEPLLRKYWGQFLTLEKLMNTISNKQGGK